MRAARAAAAAAAAAAARILAVNRHLETTANRRIQIKTTCQECSGTRELRKSTVIDGVGVGGGGNVVESAQSETDASHSS